MALSLFHFGWPLPPSPHLPCPSWWYIDSSVFQINHLSPYNFSFWVGGRPPPPNTWQVTVDHTLTLLSSRLCLYPELRLLRRVPTPRRQWRLFTSSLCRLTPRGLPINPRWFTSLPNRQIGLSRTCQLREASFSDWILISSLQLLKTFFLYGYFFLMCIHFCLF